MLLLSVVSFIVLLAEAEIDIIVPGIPELKSYFQVSVFEAELVLTLNLISHGISAIFIGALGDKYGYKRVLLYGLCVFVFGSFLIIYYSSFTILLVGRILQGAGMAAPMVLGYLILIYNQPDNIQQKQVSILNGVANISLAFTPILGSFITHRFSWIGNFNFLFILGLISILITVFYIPKNKRNLTRTRVQESINYLYILKQGKIMFYIFCSLLLPAGWFIFIGMAPILYLENYGIDLLTYGFYQGIIALFYGIFSLSSLYFINKIGKKLSMIISLAVIMLSVFILIFGFILNIFNPIYITVAILLGSVGSVIPENSLHLFAMNSMKEASGKISAMIILGRWLLSGLGIQISGLVYNLKFDMVFLIISIFWIIGVFCILLLIQKDISFKKDLEKLYTQ